MTALATGAAAAAWISAGPRRPAQLRAAIARVLDALDVCGWYPEDRPRRRDLTEAAHVLCNAAELCGVACPPAPDVFHDIDADGYVTICGARVRSNAAAGLAGLLAYRASWSVACPRCADGWRVVPMRVVCRWETAMGLGVLYHHRPDGDPPRHCAACDAADRARMAAAGELTIAAGDERTSRPRPKCERRPLPLDRAEPRCGAPRRPIAVEGAEVLR